LLDIDSGPVQEMVTPPPPVDRNELDEYLGPSGAYGDIGEMDWGLFYDETLPEEVPNESGKRF